MEFLNYLSFSVGIIGIIVIIWGVLLTVIEFLRSEYNAIKSPGIHKNNKKDVRRHLGNYILLGLEFMIAGDIIHTVLYPSKESLIVLGAIVAIRTVISYFLNKELEAD